MYFVVNLLALCVFVVQFFTGFFIPPEAQVVLLTVFDVIWRFFKGRSLFTGEISPVVKEAYQFKPVKKIWFSKMFWVCVIGMLGAGAQALFGWVIEPKYYLTIVSFVATAISAVTKRPVALE
jgi:hypothetical protein